MGEFINGDPLRPEIHAADDTTALACLDTWYRRTGHVRQRIDKIFGAWKRRYGLRRIRWRCLAKAGVVSPGVV